MRTIITLDDKKFGDQYYHAAHVQVIGDDKIQASKYVDIDELLAALNKSVVKEKQAYYMGKLPQNYYDGCIRRDKSGNLDADIILTVPGVKMRTVYENSEYMIPYPSLLFCFQIHNNGIVKTQLYAIKGIHWTDKTVLYNYPFGNVSTSMHTVCWGSNSLPEIKELRQLDAVCSLFYNCPCNNDYFSAERSTKLKYTNVRGLFEKIMNNENFPEEILVESDKGNIGNLIREFK